jgi:hypothetical protein
MRFADLAPNRLARIPAADAELGDPLPPAVEITSEPSKCPRLQCGCWELAAKRVDSGKELVYHRQPDFQVIEITPAEEAHQ